jgi:UDP-N-acetylmuramoylalanine-D-glutamate ligase
MKLTSTETVFCVGFSRFSVRSPQNPTKHGVTVLDSVAIDIVDWLFPDHISVRMPTIAVTGTNGNTTTSRMISHVFEMRRPQAGFGLHHRSIS